MMNFDIAIVGAGPAGLCFAQAVAGCGLRIAILERQPETMLANPAFDGREIALTHHSAQLMESLGLWERIDRHAISPLRDARVLNGPSLYAMNIEHGDSKKESLGYLVANHLIRQSAYEAVKSSPDITLLTESEITAINTDNDGAYISLVSGDKVKAQLLVAADSRFSETRRTMGIAAAMHDFGKTMMVCVMEHSIPHHHVAWEWFDYGQTLALLPMNGMRSSVVITLPAADIQRLMSLNEIAFNEELAIRFKHRLGTMQLTSTRHAYPLVTAYASQLVAKRFALVGDAAVGMHPVTAHGFNFGLSGIDVLANEIKTAKSRGSNIAATALLKRYERKHRLKTRPLFIATHAIAKLYGNDSIPARLIRAASLRIGNRISPFKRAVAHMLTEAN
ncbi:5-demethoxyubiquinol-8 5-hydroxylase UbiM [Methylotenera sp. L2L1]|uniref:5-demethoxyubiquinol-8 5-hydroxylase UbiM n=1 Tax=Methylotenera sp. L2L1 TaxID=1502770 RepID=UPI0009DE72BA|nr:5-demethoxyubiquinol-8 5-hydroxylase UbiM [Methylotenera sp. L2L1]